mmetsp:Transcript_6836/g.19716  ORF Transcript_6836/g.19716 Transcript_6836/m.19716 type:complete len:804 (+) Transcript_6836:5446-7857(+)
MARRRTLAATLLLAAVAGAAAQGRITLPAGSRLPEPTGTCDCTDTPTTNKPVCGGDLVTYGNECVAFCANVLIVSEGQCPVCEIVSGDCQCGDAPFEPVCAFGLTWTDKCDADCGGYSCPQTPGVCTYNANGTFEATPGDAPAGGVAAAAAKTTLPAVGSAKYDYTEGLHKTLIFFESMRSGVLDRQRLAWRGDSCSDCVGPEGEDMSGGYYEAGGSFLKLGLVEAFLVTMQAWAVDQFPGGYEKADDLTNALDAIKWGADYLVNAHSAPNQFVAVVGNSTLDFNYYGPVEEYQDFVAERPSCYINAANPGSEIAGEAAAGLAAAYIVMKANKYGAASTVNGYLSHAEDLYAFAKNNPGSYQDLKDPCLAQHGELYRSTGFVDELAWAAAWLYKATGTASYLTDARRYYGQLAQPGYSFETGEKLPGLQVLMADVDPTKAAAYQADSKVFLDLYVKQTIPHTPKGLAYPYHWGALRPATQAAMLALIESKQLRATNGDAAYAAQLFNYAKYQIDYVLGDSGRSWLVGYGTGYPDRLWHKPSYNSYIDWPLRGVDIFANWTAQQTTGKFKQFTYLQASKLEMEGSKLPQKFIAYGALYGAPLKNDGLPAFTRKDYTYAESTTDGISGITGALAGLGEYFTTNQGPQDDCGLDLGWTHPNATVLEKSINNTAVCLGVPSPVTVRNPTKAPTKPTRRPTRRAAAAGGTPDSAGAPDAAGSPNDAAAPDTAPDAAQPIAAEPDAASTPDGITNGGITSGDSPVTAPGPSSASPDGATAAPTSAAASTAVFSVALCTAVAIAALALAA